ncbi:radical SAM protein [Schaedlerella arabinosiphila]|jgi:Predicted Fe-S oxidoreductases|uniref:Radical SAM protein n=1 Tax=Schaedlerella arabinosiphila TaxID=2044587 RepID=A0A3R8KX78_9FIRM|nr:radical SAM protein [Schaedlerella arabinosiphila]RRK33790.1 radical SAM protein [Schaedlerella arabinosiphila]
MKNIAISNANFLNYLRENEIIYPLVMSIDVIENCNYRCKHCYIKYSFKESEDNCLSFDELDELFVQLGKYGVASVNLTGGEPLLRKDIVEIIKSAKRNNLYCCLKSNGFFLSKDLIHTFESIGLDEIVLSIYGMDNKEYQDVTGFAATEKVGVCEKLFENIRYLNSSKIRTELRYVLLKQNYKSYARFVEMCKKIGLKQGQYDFIIDINPDNSSDECTSNNGMDAKQQEEFLRQFYKLDKETFYLKYNNDYKYKKCLVGRQLLHIKCNGDIYPCPNFPISVGNIKEQTFKEIWENSPLLNELRDISEENFDCGTCKDRDKCYHICIGAIYVWNKCENYKKSNISYCQYKREFYSIVDKIKAEVVN